MNKRIKWWAIVFGIYLLIAMSLAYTFTLEGLKGITIFHFVIPFLYSLPILFNKKEGGVVALILTLIIFLIVDKYVLMGWGFLYMVFILPLIVALFIPSMLIINKLETMGRSRGKIRNKTKFQKKTWIAVALVIGYIIYAYLANIF